MHTPRLFKCTSGKFQDLTYSHTCIYQFTLSFNRCYKVSDATNTHSFIQDLLSTYYAPDTLLGMRYDRKQDRYITCLYRACHLAYAVLSNMKDSEKQMRAFANVNEATVSLGGRKKT